MISHELLHVTLIPSDFVVVDLPAVAAVPALWGDVPGKCVMCGRRATGPNCTCGRDPLKLGWSRIGLGCVKFEKLVTNSD